MTMRSSSARHARARGDALRDAARRRSSCRRPPRPRGTGCSRGAWRARRASARSPSSRPTTGSSSPRAAVAGEVLAELGQDGKSFGSRAKRSSLLGRPRQAQDLAWHPGGRACRSWPAARRPGPAACARGRCGRRRHRARLRGGLDACGARDEARRGGRLGARRRRRGGASRVDGISEGALADGVLGREPPGRRDPHGELHRGGAELRDVGTALDEGAVRGGGALLAEREKQVDRGGRASPPRPANSRARWMARTMASRSSSVVTRAAERRTAASSRRSRRRSAAAPGLPAIGGEQVPGGGAVGLPLGEVLRQLAEGDELGLGAIGDAGRDEGGHAGSPSPLAHPAPPGQHSGEPPPETPRASAERPPFPLPFCPCSG